MQPALSDWAGRVRQRTDDLIGVELIAPAPEVGTSWGGPFRAIANDNQEYFVKTLAACPPGRGSSLAVEMIVARGKVDRRSCLRYIAGLYLGCFRRVATPA